MKRFAIIIVLVALGLLYTGWLMLAPLGSSGSGQLVDLPAGSGSWRIARQLQSAGVIRSALAFEAWHLLHPKRRLKAGTYLFDSRTSAVVVFNRIARGDVFTYTLTVPEGYNRFDIASTLDQMGVLPSDQFLRATANPSLILSIDPQATSLEGYLYPDTYRIPPHAAAQQIAAMMVKRFTEELKTTGGEMFGAGGRWVGGLARPHPATLHEWVSMASLVEKESALPSERSMIAGLFYNRLARGMPLQCDPTVIYAELLANRYTGALHHADIGYNSAYNTYVHSGLPPGPIANPGRASLLAAARPQPNDYIYFVSNGHGAHRFARTLQEHDRNVALYRRDQQKGNGQLAHE